MVDFVSFFAFVLTDLCTSVYYQKKDFKEAVL